jgi:S1-C subfamily serine protease
MIQKIIVGLMALVLSVVTPMVFMDHVRVATEIKTLTDSSYLAYLEITKLKTKLDFSQIRAATRLLYVPGLGNGSGVMIAPGRMLTAAHVAKINEQVPLLLNGKPIKVLKIDEDIDIALLEVDEACPCVSLTDKLPAVDQVAYIVGFPLHSEEMPQYLTEGRIQGTTTKYNRTLTSVPAAPGNSGGGLFVYEDGKWKLAGILVSVSGMGNMFGLIMVFHMSHSVDIESIKKFLSE